MGSKGKSRSTSAPGLLRSQDFAVIPAVHGSGGLFSPACRPEAGSLGQAPMSSACDAEDVGLNTCRRCPAQSTGASSYGLPLSNELDRGRVQIDVRSLPVSIQPRPSVRMGAHGFVCPPGIVLSCRSREEPSEDPLNLGKAHPHNWIGLPGQILARQIVNAHVVYLPEGHRRRGPWFSQGMAFRPVNGPCAGWSIGIHPPVAMATMG